ncbi:hypothetical protein [uncultured Streptomyces sp.]|uniref:hypothetical protein n=1 Tax=uncultured Streptomyces sp. TaxID=174707 RepID=UPI00261EADB7|nr:hypothetical protein [uncultured Streptomyces sp.]
MTTETAFEDHEGRAIAWQVAPDGAGDPLRVGLRIGVPAGEERWTCTPEAARRLAAALLAAAGEAELARTADPVSVPARDLRRGDVRDGPRPMTVDGVRVEGGSVQVTWKSPAGRSWTQMYDGSVPIALRRRSGSDG